MATQDKNKYGQYFTPKQVADFMVSLLSIDKDSKVLEPSCGEGVFLDALKEKGFTNIEGIELDSELSVGSKHKISYKDYLLSEDLSNSFDGIIGNPPYIRWKNLPSELKESLQASSVWKKYCTSLSDYSTCFIAKAALDLKDNGNLVFITPEYWLYTHHSQKLRNLLLELGSVDRIYHFDESPIFSGAIASFIVFRFVKSKKLETTAWKIKSSDSYSHEQLKELDRDGKLDFFEKVFINKFEKNKRWTLENKVIAQRLNSFEEACSTDTMFKDEPYTISGICDIANGMVSGLDKAFQIEDLEFTKQEREALIPVPKAKQLDGFIVDKTTNYIFLTEKISEEDFIQHYPNFYQRLAPFKEDLLKRYDYKKGFSEYWYWSFLRNYNTLKRDMSKIFVPCKERLGNKQSYRFTIAQSGVFPTQDVTALVPKEKVKESIYYIHAFLKLPIVTEWIQNRGVLRGGVAEFSEAPLGSIPFRKINWDNKLEVDLHNKIVELAMQNSKKEQNFNNEIERLFSDLLN